MICDLFLERYSYTQLKHLWFFLMKHILAKIQKAWVWICFLYVYIYSQLVKSTTVLGCYCCCDKITWPNGTYGGKHVSWITVPEGESIMIREVWQQVRIKKLKKYIFNHKHKVESKWKWGEAVPPQGPPPVEYLLQPSSTSQSFHSLPNSITSCGPTCKYPAYEDISYSNHHSDGVYIFSFT